MEMVRSDYNPLNLKLLTGISSFQFDMAANNLCLIILFNIHFHMYFHVDFLVFFSRTRFFKNEHGHNSKKRANRNFWDEFFCLSCILNFVKTVCERKSKEKARILYMFKKLSQHVNCGLCGTHHCKITSSNAIYNQRAALLIL